MITVVVGKEIEKIKGDFESYLNGLNMVGEISYSQYSELYDEGTKQIQKAYELGKSELEKENSELKADNDARKFAMAMSEKVEKQLREENSKLKEALEGYKKIAKWCDNCDKIAELKSENQKWKDEWQEQVQKATDEGYARTLQTIQLSKAKELFKRFIETSNPIYFEEDRQKVKAEAEQFLKDCEVEK